MFWMNLVRVKILIAFFRGIFELEKLKLVRLHFIAFIAVCCLFSNAAQAQRPGGPGSSQGDQLSPVIEWDKRAEVGERLTGLGLDLLGDSIDPHTGSISFQHTDINLPGNSGLPVSLTRKLSQSYFYSLSVDAEFGDWNYDVPRLHVTTAYAVNAWAGTRCTNPASTFAKRQYSNSSGSGSYAYPVEYSNGLIMEVPGQGSQQVLQPSPNVALPFPSSAKYVTSENWYLTCGSANDGGQGFVAHAPNGNTYYFDHYIEYLDTKMGSITIDGGNAGASKHIARTKAMLMATEVTDVNGNWVKYEYDGSNRLTEIHSNDGRSITIAYSGSSKYIVSATANGRTWNYGYTTHSLTNPFVGDNGNNKKILSSVTRPDGQSWSFTLTNMHKRAYSGTRCHNSGGTLSLTHPNGTTGTFAITETNHRSGPSEWITETTLRCAGFVNNRTPTYYDIMHGTMDTMAVTQKTISSPTIPTSTWTYTYEEDHVETRYPTGHQYAGHPIDTSLDDPTNWTKIVGPTGEETTYYHFWNRVNGSVFGGKLDRVETRASTGGAVLETQKNHYVQTGVFGYSYIPNTYIGNPISRVLSPESAGRPIQVAKTITTRNGDTFTTEASFNIDQSSSNYSYSKPIQTKTYSNMSSDHRITDTTYEHNTSNWILGLPKTVTHNGRPTAEYLYYPNTGQLDEFKKYGALQIKFGYNSDGTTAWIEDALTPPRRTQALDWHRGIPEKVIRPDGSFFEQTIDDNGWVTDSTDFLQRTTTYQRDNMGRVTLVTPHGAWDDTSIAYNFTGGGAVQTITKGQAQTTITYDSLFRPTLEHTNDLSSAWDAYTRTTYDAKGRTTFKSLPSAIAMEPNGTTYTYDGLGRVVTQTETAANAVTFHEYLSGHKTRITDPLGNSKLYTSAGYDGPESEDYRLIEEFGGTSLMRSTAISKNIWGETQQVRQFGSLGGNTVDQSQFFFYNAQRRLCGYREKEGGDTYYQYDTVGQMIAYAKGQSGASNACPLPSGNAKVSLTYDLVGQLKETIFADAETPNILRTYDNNGNVKTVNRNGVNWAYNYHPHADLLINETLTLDGKSFPLTYAYNSSQHMTSRSYPTGDTVEFMPDGLGRAKAAKKGSLFYANDLNYHEGGALTAMNYGNGQAFTQTLNNRLLPQRLMAVNGGVKALDLTYTYDASAKVTAITDGAVSGNNRNFTYDGLGQLKTASGPWGSATNTYDSLGNIRSRIMNGGPWGTRTIDLQIDNNNRVYQSIDSRAVGLGGTGTRTVNYDIRGNVTTLGLLGMVYDMSDQPTNISGTANGVGVANGTYRYDGNLKRVRSILNGKTIYNVYDASGALVHVEKIAGAGQSAERSDYITAGGKAIARVVKNGPVYYSYSDHLGSPVTTMRSDTGAIERERYTPFGIAMDNPPSLTDQAGFTGHIKDSATGLNYMQARYYDPIMGRFLSIDPVTFLDQPYPGQFNRYAYTWNDPINANDPDGEFLNFVAKFVVDVGLEVAIQVASGEDINLGSAAKGAALGVLDPTKTARKVAKLGKLANTARKAKKACCFVAGTLVDTKDGLRPIEEIKVGDSVLSRNPETGETTYKTVTNIIPKHDRVIWDVALIGNIGTSELFETTDEHPWWVVDATGRGSWKRTDELSEGMFVTTADNQTMTITSVLNTAQIDATYNLTVADFETYFVGESKVLVHNCEQCGKACSIGPAPNPRKQVTSSHSTRKRAKDARPRAAPKKAGEKRTTRQSRNQNGMGNKSESHPDSNHTDSHFHDRNHNDQTKPNVHYTYPD